MHVSSTNLHVQQHLHAVKRIVSSGVKREI